MSVNDWVVIDRRFNGPPTSANGGYTCGLVGAALEAPSVRVSLRKPPPLEVPLLRRREHDGSVSLLSGDDLIATAAPAAVQAHAPPAPTVAEAEIATRGYVGFAHHRFPTCFVCGTAREDGLRIYAGQVTDGPLIASPWTPRSDDPRFVWAVLDCPSAYAIESLDHRTQIVVLASLTVELRNPPAPGSGMSSPRGRSPARAASTTRLLRSTTRPDASLPLPTPCGLSCPTPTRSGADPSEKVGLQPQARGYRRFREAETADREPRTMSTAPRGGFAVIDAHRLGSRGYVGFLWDAADLWRARSATVVGASAHSHGNRWVVTVI